MQAQHKGTLVFQWFPTCIGKIPTSFVSRFISGTTHWPVQWPDTIANRSAHCP